MSSRDSDRGVSSTANEMCHEARGPREERLRYSKGLMACVWTYWQLFL